MQMQPAVWILSESTLELAEKIRKEFTGAHIYAPKKVNNRDNDISANFPGSFFQYESLQEELSGKFKSYDAHIFVMSTGIVVRLVSGLLVSKTTDPAIVVVDPEGLHAISLISGHLGGANELTKDVAKAIGAVPVITTATDLKGITAFDEVARIIGAKILNPRLIKVTSVSLLEGKKVGFIGPKDIYNRFYPSSPNVIFLKELPEDSENFSAFCIFTDEFFDLPPHLLEKTLIIALPTLAAGIGCHIGTGKNEIIDGIKQVFGKHSLLVESIFTLASVDAKKNERGLIEASAELGVPIIFFSSGELEEEGTLFSEPSKYVEKHVGARGVAEPAAFLAAGNGAEIVVKKNKLKNMTVAVARRHIDVPQNSQSKLYAVGIGPGDLSQMTVRARQVLAEADTVVGYKTYIELIRPLISGKNVITTGMTKEVDRCKRAIEEARKGHRVAVVSSGDSGIYGMAGLIYELLGKDTDIEVEVVPGVTASTAAAAISGAPLMCDYISLSLSDLLQPTDEVKRRIRVAAASDLVTVVYNPKSKRRTELIEYLQEEFLKHRDPGTPVAIVTNSYRDNQNMELCRLADFTDREITMTSLVIIGNSQTQVVGGRIITKRGYRGI